MTDCSKIPTLTDIEDSKAAMDDIQSFTYSNVDSFIDAKGVPRDTVTGRLKKMGYESPIPYTGSIVFSANDNTKTIEKDGVIYAPLPSSLPFTTTSWFNDESKFFVVQGLTNDDIINDITQEYTFQSVSAFQASGLTFPDGKTIILVDRDAKFTKITGTGTANGFNIIASSVSNQSLQLNVGIIINAKQWGCVADGIADDTLVRTNFIEYVKAANNVVGYFPAGIYKFSDMPNLASENTTWLGDGSGLTEFLYTGSGSGLLCDAFPILNDGNQPFTNNCDISGIIVKGNSSMTRGVDVQGLARSTWKDIKVTGGDISNANSVGFDFKSCSLNNFEGLICSYVDSGGVGVNIPFRGMFMKPGTRNSINMGGCSNNVFVSTYMEGMVIGAQLALNGGDNNSFMGGSMEACTDYGLIVGTICRYNTFIGLGFENLYAANFDVSDSGMYNRYQGCYASHHVNLSGIGLVISGGFYEQITAAANCRACLVEKITVNHWNTGGNGLVDLSPDLKFNTIIDSPTNTYRTSGSGRVQVTPTGSPFTYDNNTAIPQKIIVIGGTITQILVDHHGDTWIEPNPTPSAGAIDRGVYILQPLEKLIVSYSVAPVLNKIPLKSL